MMRTSDDVLECFYEITEIRVARGNQFYILEV